MDKHVKKILFLLLILVLGCCNPKKQDNLDLIEYPIELNSVSKLVLKAYKSINNENIFSEICQLLNDSINNRTDYFHLHSAVNIIISENEIVEIDLGFIEWNDPLPCISGGFFYICIKDEKTIFVQHKQSNIANLKEEIKKSFVLELENLPRGVAFRKIHTDSFGEVEVANFLVFISINAKGNKLSSNEWLLFFKCFQEVANFFEEERDNLSIEKLGKNFNSLTFEQKDAISEIAGYNIILFFDRECPPDWYDNK